MCRIPDTLTSPVTQIWLSVHVHQTSKASVKINNPLARRCLRSVLYRINFTFRILIDQAPFQIPIIHYDQNRTIKFQFVRKRRKPNFLIGDNSKISVCSTFPEALVKINNPLAWRCLLRVLYRINFTFRILTDQAPFWILIVQWDQNKAIEFQFVRKRGNLNFLTGDHLRY